MLPGGFAREPPKHVWRIQKWKLSASTLVRFTSANSRCTRRVPSVASRVPDRSRRSPELQWPAGWGRPMSGWRRTKEGWSLKLEKKNAAQHVITTDLHICYCPWDTRASAMAEYKFGWCLWSKKAEQRAHCVFSPSWGGGCSLSGLRCNRRRWWRTWPPPPQSGWRLGRWEMCPAPNLPGGEETQKGFVVIATSHFLLFVGFFFLKSINFHQASSLHSPYRLLIISGLAQDVLRAIGGDQSKARLIHPSSPKKLQIQINHARVVKIGK